MSEYTPRVRTRLDIAAAAFAQADAAYDEAHRVWWWSTGVDRDESMPDNVRDTMLATIAAERELRDAARAASGMKERST